MWVLAIPIRCIVGAPGFIELRGIKFSVPMSEVVGFQCFLRAQLLWIGKTVPTPVAHGAERHTIGIQLWERL